MNTAEKRRIIAAEKADDIRNWPTNVHFLCIKVSSFYFYCSELTAHLVLHLIGVV
jgi:hypothetical protein